MALGGDFVADTQLTRPTLPHDRPFLSGPPHADATSFAELQKDARAGVGETLGLAHIPVAALVKDSLELAMSMSRRRAPRRVHERVGERRLPAGVEAVTSLAAPPTT